MKLVEAENGIYQVHFKGMEGKRCRVTTGCRNKEEAKQVVKESKIKELEMTTKTGRLTQAAISYIMAGTKLTVQQAYESYKEWAVKDATSRYTYDCVYFPTLQAWIRDTEAGGKSPFTLTDSDLNSWINREGPHKLSTRKTWAAAFKSFWKFLSIRGWCAGNAALGIKVKETLLTYAQKEPKVKQCFTEDEITRLINAPKCQEDLFWKAAVIIGRYAGLRLGDIAQLQWASLGEYTLKVFTDKTDAPVVLPLEHPHLKALVNQLSGIPKEVRNDQTYVWPDQCAIVRDPQRRALLSVYFSRICESVNIEGKSFHCLRHTCATRLAEEGKMTPEIARLLGHAPKRVSPWAITEGYIHKGKE